MPFIQSVLRTPAIDIMIEVLNALKYCIPTPRLLSIFNIIKLLLCEQEPQKC